MLIPNGCQTIWNTHPEVSPLRSAFARHFGRARAFGQDARRLRGVMGGFPGEFSTLFESRQGLAGGRSGAGRGFVLFLVWTPLGLGRAWPGRREHALSQDPGRPPGVMG